MLENGLFFLIMLLACVISGMVGFGSNILALPFLSLFLDVKTIVPVLILTVLCNGIPRLLTQYRNVNLKVYLTMVPLAIIGAFLGLRLVNVLHEGWMKLLLACLMLLVAIRGLRSLRKTDETPAVKKPSPLFYGIPVAAGIMQAAFACGGPIFNIYILLNLTRKEEIRATQFAIGVTSAGIITLQHILRGSYQGQTLHFVFLLIPAVLLSYIISERLFRRIDGRQFLHMVYILLILTGLMTGWQALKLF